MRIGIITFWDSNDNYGQQLQCWALQQKLISLGHSPFLIKFKRKREDIFHVPLWKLVIKLLLVYPYYKNWVYIRKEKKKNALKDRNSKINNQRLFEKFRNDYLIFSESSYEGIEQLRNNPPVADAYITGSDQVWGTPLLDEDTKAYFLDFGPKECKRVSYAASFGMSEYPDNAKENLSKSLSLFNGISVREKEGISICEQLGYAAVNVVDPTLLLSANDYIQKLSIEKNFEKPYVFVYSINIKDSKEIYWNSLQCLSRRNNLELIVTPSSGYWQFDDIFDGAQYKYATIQEWISLISNAELVVTPSFHGIVFCILNNTKFLYSPVHGAWSKGNNRVINLLEELSLTEFVLRDESDYLNALKAEIDWITIGQKINKLRKDSTLFLIDNLK